MRSLAAAAAGALLFTGVAADAAGPAHDADLQCLLAMGALKANGNAATKAAGASGILYFLGKINGGSPGIDLVGALQAEANKLKGQPVKAIAERCLQEIETNTARLAASTPKVQGPK